MLSAYEVVEAVAEGLDNAGVARRLFMSEGMGSTAPPTDGMEQSRVPPSQLSSSKPNRTRVSVSRFHRIMIRLSENFLSVRLRAARQPVQ